MSDNDLVSIIIACYNAENYIDDCLNSLVNQTYKNIEIIICDDCSTDNSFNLLSLWKERDSRIVLLKNESNRYAAYTRNKCIEASKGAFIAIQDIDDVSAINRIEISVQQLKQSEFYFVSTGTGNFIDDFKKIRSYRIPKKLYPRKKDFLWTLPFMHGATMFKRECLISIGVYREAEETRRCQDYDLFMRLYAKNYYGFNIKDILYFYRLDLDNYKRRTWKARKGEIKIRRQRFKDLGLLPWGWIFIYKPFFAHIMNKIRIFFRK